MVVKPFLPPGGGGGGAQAMAAYRTAARMFPGLHQPLLGMALEYARMNNMELAEQLARQAYQRCPWDPLLCHELGVLAFRSHKLDEAKDWFHNALQHMPGGTPTAAWEPTLVNLGHVYRKKMHFDEAIKLYQQALSLRPGMAGTFAALGYTYHLQAKLGDAISYYNKALGLHPEDTFTTEMLTLAIMEECVSALPPDVELPL
eukprot:jgi/Botrbrau1/1425/Bobra.0063s0117.2